MADPNPREQEQSIKDRKRLLYDEEDLPAPSSSSATRKPFSAHLRDTPATPLAPLTKGILWALAVVVALLLLGAVLKSQRPRTPRPKTPTSFRGPDMRMKPVRSPHSHPERAVGENMLQPFS